MITLEESHDPRMASYRHDIITGYESRTRTTSGENAVSKSNGLNNNKIKSNNIDKIVDDETPCVTENWNSRNLNAAESIYVDWRRAENSCCNRASRRTGHFLKTKKIIPSIKITWMSLFLVLIVLVTITRPTNAGTVDDTDKQDAVAKREAVSGKNEDNQKRIVCYYTNWSVYRPGTAKFSPQNINPYLCTHLIYAFGGLDRENGLRPYDKYQDIEQGGYAKFTGLKTYNKALKTMLAIGGWNEGSARFSPLVADEERRREFVKNAVKFLRQNHFDGLDLDWEYPAFRDGGKTKDRQNYARLVQELREEFDRESNKTGRPRLLLTMAVPAGIEYIDKGYDVPKLNRYLDFMNLLSYDYHSAFEPAVNHHSPLYSLDDNQDDEYNFDAHLSIDYTIKHYLKSGADRNKLVLGIPTYGRSYTLFNPDSNQIGSPADGPGEQGDATREKGYLAYYEICASLKKDDEWKVEQPKRSAMGPYAFKGNQWVGYDDEDIVKEKAKYVNDHDLGGIMFWSIDNDDFRGNCHKRPYPLIEAGKEAMLGSKQKQGDKDESRPSTSSSTSLKSIKPSRPLTSTPQQRVQSKPKTKLGTPVTQRSQSRINTTPPPSTTSKASALNELTTPEPPTTPDPGSDFVCKDEGFFPHPRDCKKYFWCLDSGPSNLGIVAHQFTCPSGLFFNKAADSCDFTRNVLCKDKKEGSTSKTTTTSTATYAPPTTTTAATTRTKITAATARSTGIRYTFPTTTTTTTTEAPSPPEQDEQAEEEDDDYDHVEEDPQAIKQLIDLIKKLGGVAELEKQLENAAASGSGANADITPPSISKNLYERVLTPSKYQSPYKNGPSGPQNEGLAGLDDGTSYRREKPQYITIARDRTTNREKVSDEENVRQEAPFRKGETRIEYKTLNRNNKPRVEEEISSDEEEKSFVDSEERYQPTSTSVPKYKIIDRRKPVSAGSTGSQEETLENDSQEDEPDENDSVDKQIRNKSQDPDFSSRFRYKTIQRNRGPPATFSESPQSESSTLGQRQSLEQTTPYSSRYVTLSRQRRPPSSATPNSLQSEEEENTERESEDATSSSSSSPYYRNKDNQSKFTKLRSSSKSNLFNQDDEEDSISSADDVKEDNEQDRPRFGSNKVNTRGRLVTRRPPIIIQRRPSSAVDSSTANVERIENISSSDVEDRTESLKTARPTVNRSQGKYKRIRVNKLINDNNDGILEDSNGPPQGRIALTTTDSPFASTEIQNSNEDNISSTFRGSTTVRPKKFEFPLRTGRPGGNFLPKPQQLIGTGDPVVVTGPGFIDEQILETKEENSGALENDKSSTISDLANVAVAAIQSLATPTRSPPPSTVLHETNKHRSSIIGSTRRTPIVTPAIASNTTNVPVNRGSVRPFEKKRRPTSVNKPSSSSSYQNGKHRGTDPAHYSEPVADFESSDYYVAEPVDVPLSGKVRIHNDGYIECLDVGNFPHPFSCKKFISCAKMESEHLLGWEYTCPRGLSFDPIGGICNWSAGLGCKE